MFAACLCIPSVDLWASVSAAGNKSRFFQRARVGSSGKSGEKNGAEGYKYERAGAAENRGEKRG